MRRQKLILLGSLALTVQTVCLADPAMEGDWMITVKPDGAEITGLLQLEQENGNWHAWVEGGPADVEVDGDQLSMRIDSRDLRGFVFDRHLTGKLEKDRLMGTFEVESEADVNASSGTWSAVRRSSPMPPQEPMPVDLTGIWTTAPGQDFRKYSMDLTPKAEAWLAEYVLHYDQPNVRCVSPGIVAMVAWGAYPFEILDGDTHLTFIYEVESEVRRVYMDGRDPPEYYPNSAMGFSTGRWEGSDLHVDTVLLSANVRDFRGEPISENAKMHEVYKVSEDGSTLTAVISLLDPENYQRPPIRRRKWTRNPDTEIFPYECDPDSFYRQMYNEDLLEMYFGRSKRRL